MTATDQAEKILKHIDGEFADWANLKGSKFPDIVAKALKTLEESQCYFDQEFLVTDMKVLKKKYGDEHLHVSLKEFMKTEKHVKDLAVQVARIKATKEASREEK